MRHALLSVAAEAVAQHLGEAEDLVVPHHRPVLRPLRDGDGDAHTHVDVADVVPTQQRPEKVGGAAEAVVRPKERVLEIDV